MSLEMPRVDNVRGGATYFEGCYDFRRPGRAGRKARLWYSPVLGAKPSGKDQQDGGGSHSKHQLPGTRRTTEGFRAGTALTGDPCLVPAPTSGGSRPLLTSAPGESNDVF